MDNHHEERPSLFDLSIDPSSEQSLEQASKWAKFLAIVFICAAVLTAVLFAFLGDRLSLLLQSFIGYRLQSLFLLIIVVALAIVGLFIMLLLRFAAFTSKGIKETNQQDLEKGIGSLKVYFILSGVFGILGLLATIIGYLR